jgi:sulfur carrier protein
MIEVTVNGKPVSLEAPMTIEQLLVTAQVPPNYLAVEINADVVPRELHGAKLVNDGDEVEVVTLVGGG